MPQQQSCPLEILVLAGSLRQASLNARLASLAAKIARTHGASVHLASMQTFDCPSYDGDREASEGIPAPATHLRDQIAATDAFIIAAPEYNGSVSGVLKNAIDWVSRFRPQPFNGKQALLLSASPSMAGGNRGLWALRVPLEHLGTRVYPDMFSLAQAHDAFDDDGALKNRTLQQRLDTTLS